MKNIALLLIAFLFLSAERLFPYTVNFGGTPYYGTVFYNDVTGMWTGANHWEAAHYDYTPQSGVSFREDGNDASYGLTGTFSIEPEAGDALSGTVNILIGCSYTEQYLQELANFVAPPFSAKYDANLTVQYGEFPSMDLASFPVCSNSTFSVTLNIGQAYQLNGTLNAGGVVEQTGWMNVPGTWIPSVIDPIQVGTASLTASATLGDYSIQVVPEPGSLVLFLVGLPCLGFAISRGKFMCRRDCMDGNS